MHRASNTIIPESPDREPCCNGVVPLYNIIYLVAQQRSGEACRVCRRWLVDVSTNSEPYQWVHGDPIPPAVADY